MNSERWEVATIVSGALQGAIIRGLLEAQGIKVRALEESAGAVFGFGVGPTSEVEISVRPEDLERALLVLEAYESGGLENFDANQIEPLPED